ncbi:MAG: hypothetical protein OEO21_07630 [Candidatus Krumholzibacteria bacterium]|nr:hypothetical protein [Candidatus Krumholzibacteria bacterium]
MKRFMPVIGAVVLALAITTVAVHATQVLFRTPRQLGAESALVVQGRVTSVQSYWNPSHTKILTETRVVVEDTFKGTRAGAVTVMQLGGVVDNVRMTVHGALQWREGEEVVLFLEPFDAGRYQVSGFTQGKFGVERDESTGEAYVRALEQRDAEMVGVPGAETGAVVKPKKMRVAAFIANALGKE